MSVQLHFIENTSTLLCSLQGSYIIINKHLIMKSQTDSDFQPCSEDEHVKIADPKLQSKKRKALLKMKDVSTKHSGLWNKIEN